MENTPQKQNSEVKCPYCNSKETVKRGIRKTNNRGDMHLMIIKEDSKLGKLIKKEAEKRVKDKKE